VDVSVEGVAADSLGARSVGAIPFAIARRLVAEVVLVSDAAIGEAQARLWTDTRIATEPGGAAALAALTSSVYRPAKGERVGVLVCGGNVDLAVLNRLAAARPGAEDRGRRLAEIPRRRRTWQLWST
jgi:threonine dehydratase